MRRKSIINKLLDAAFKELQHDTGPQDREYLYQRRVLHDRFLKILSQYQILTRSGA